MQRKLTRIKDLNKFIFKIIKNIYNSKIENIQRIAVLKTKDILRVTITSINIRKTENIVKTVIYSNNIVNIY